MFFSNSLKRNRVNSSPTKAHGEIDSSLGSQMWSAASTQGDGDSQTLLRPAQYGSECSGMSREHYTSHESTIVPKLPELKEKGLRHDFENTAESIPVITMNCSANNGRANAMSEIADASNVTLEIDSNNNCPLSSSVATCNGSSNGSLSSSHISHDQTDQTYNKDKSRNHRNGKEGKKTKSSSSSVHCGFSLGLERSKELPEKRPNSCPKTVGKHKPNYIQTTAQENPSPKHSKARSQSLLERRKGGKETKYAMSNSGELKPKRKFSFPRPLSPRLNSSSPKPLASPGAVVTSSRPSKRRTSITAAAAAFAAATAGAPCSPSSPLTSSHARFSFRKC